MTVFSDQKFCDGCGAVCRRVVRVIGHSLETGEPKRRGYFRCPNKRWWSLADHMDAPIFMDFGGSGLEEKDG